jgi:hypothetical protein
LACHQTKQRFDLALRQGGRTEARSASRGPDDSFVLYINQSWLCPPTRHVLCVAIRHWSEVGCHRGPVEPMPGSAGSRFGLRSVARSPGTFNFEHLVCVASVGTFNLVNSVLAGLVVFTGRLYFRTLGHKQRSSCLPDPRQVRAV